MNLIHLGQCEAKDCPKYDGDHCQLWLVADKRLCWFCWRMALGIKITSRAVEHYYGVAFAEMVEMARFRRRPAA